MSLLNQQIKRIGRMHHKTGKAPTVLDISRQDYESIVDEVVGQSRRSDGTKPERPWGIYEDTLRIMTQLGEVILVCLEPKL